MWDFFFSSPSSKNKKVLFLSSKIRQKTKTKLIQKHLKIIKMLASHWTRKYSFIIDGKNKLHQEYEKNIERRKKIQET